MSECSILWQQPDKMFHLSSGAPFVLCVCLGVGSLCMSGCSILWQQPVKMFHVTLLSSVCVCVCLGVCVLVYVRMLHPLATACQDVPSFVRCPFFPLCVYMCVSGRLGPHVYQDAPSFGNSLSRCSIFRQVTLLSSVCVCVCICVCVRAFGSLCMSGCSILRQQPVKMFYLSSGDPFVLCVCMCVSGRLCPHVCQDAPSFGNSLSRCSIFRQVTLSSCVCMYVCVYVCVCVGALGSLCMSGCSILWQQPVKMFHLSSGDPFVLCVCICVCVWAFGSSCMSGCSILWQQPLKMFHFSSDDPFVLCVCMCVCVWAFGSLCMSGCSILRQQPVKLFHLSSGDPFVLCVCMCVCVSGRLGPGVCQEAPSFGNSQSRCSIFRQVTLLSSVHACLCLCVSVNICV